MSKRRWVWSLAAFLLVATGAAYLYARWTRHVEGGRDALLAGMPVDAGAVLFVDLADLRPTRFAAELFQWAPRTSSDVDAEYSQFLRDTGFDYERDLDRVALALLKRGADTLFFAVADGRFDRRKISAYALRTGTREVHGSREIFIVPLTG